MFALFPVLTFWMKIDRSLNARHIPGNGTLFGWLTLALFAVLVALLGGSSRSDAIQIAALRPLSALFMIPAVYLITTAQLREARVVVLLLALWTVWLAAQLVPLPAGLWQSLPDRDLIARLDELTGIEGVMRPISLVPSRGINALAALIVPVAALCLALSMRMRSRDLLLVIAALGVFDALLGIAQVALGGSGPLYFYAVTNEGAPVGIFANENHSAVFSAVVLLVLVRLGIDAGLKARAAGVGIAISAAFLVVLLAVTISGSRAGFGVALVALAATTVMVYFSVSQHRHSLGSRRPRGLLAEWMIRNPGKLLAGALAIVAALVVLLVFSDRTPGLEGAFSKNALADLRWQLWPTLETMMSRHWMLGIGFGSFEEAYHIYERTELLQPIYINQAHNDWAQLVIEGGFPAVALAGALLVWILRSVREIGVTRIDQRSTAVFWGAIVVIIALGSVVDYPLRAPVFQAVAMWLLAALAFDRGGTREV